jgi:hypothetical protein
VSWTEQMVWTSVALPLAGCAPETRSPNDGFTYDDTVRILDPVNGATIEPDLTVTFETGSAVQSVELRVDDQGVETVPAADGTLTVTLDEGRHALDLVGLDATGATLGDHAITVHVIEEDPEGTARWVAIVSPADGAEVYNPVVFTLDASEDVDRIEVLADGWSLGSVAPGELLTHTFSATGYPRAVEARAVADDETVATDAITLTVLDPNPVPVSEDLNDLVQKLLAEYPTDGTHDYYWPSDSSWEGTTQDIWYLDTLVAEGDPEGRCYCVGLTWEVFMHAFDAADAQTGGTGSLNGLDVDDLREFQVDWYVRELLGAGASDALDAYGLGGRVTDFGQVKPGDFVQFWRNSGSGHSVIFQDWERDGDDRIVGLRYWSTQASTDGIDYNDEYFGPGSSDVDPNLVFVARAASPSEWVPWGG